MPDWLLVLTLLLVGIALCCVNSWLDDLIYSTEVEQGAGAVELGRGSHGPYCGSEGSCRGLWRLRLRIRR